MIGQNLVSRRQNVFYQEQYSIKADHVKLERGSDLTFPNHIHSSFEAIIATEGEMEITVADKKYTISGNECVLVFPNQMHEIKTECHAKHLILIFSPQLVRAYSKKFEVYVPLTNKFVLDEYYIKKISDLDSTKSTVELKGLLYSICGEFDKSVEYAEIKSDGQNLLFKIFKFVEKNYKGKCSLYELANETTYNYVYLSKLFSKNTGINYTEYVCRYRVNESCYLLMNTNNTMLDIAYECGFECLRSFNRSFKSVMGVSPSEYRKQRIMK